ncbi:MAG: alpha/beta hydrolase [Anaerolineaceae bacterium]|nr:alpha/beta hydrolase [Anaerolineaceae bacterium]
MSTKNTDYGKWLEEILDHLEVKQIKVVGFSFGGWIACKLAIYNPKRIDKIVLLSPIGLVSFRVQYWMRAPVLLLNMMVFQTDSSIGKFATLIAGPTATKDVIEELVVSAKVFLKNFYMDAIPYRIKKEDLKKFLGPMMLLVGRHDTFCEPEDVVSCIRECLPTAQTEIIEDIGHVVYFEKPEFVNARILEFFENDL